MRNLKRALSLGLTAAMISGLMVMGSSAASSSYTDVADTDNVEAIEVLKAVGIMVGDESGDFNPDQKVTRNEMAVVMSNLMAYNVATYANTSPFTDVPSWAEPYVAACWTNGITAGTSATTYGGSESVTTAQAALMLMKALGYFQYASDFGSDWQLSTVSQGNRIDLFEDVDSGVREAMTRNDLAQLVLNTLEAGTVEAEADGSFSVGDVTFVSNVSYKFVTSGRSYAYAINDRLDTNNDGTYSTGAIVELGEKLYQGDLTKEEDKDDFGRPADIWEYQAKEVGTFPNEADYTFTAKVTSKALYNEIGKTAAENYAMNVYFNGNLVEDYGKGDLARNKADDDADFVYKETGDEKLTGNGVITEVFVDGTNEVVNVAIMEQYAAEVLTVDSEDGTITLSDLSDDGPVVASDEFEATGFAEDDIVIYTFANDKIQSVYAAEEMSGDVTAVRTATATNTDGKVAEEDEGDYFVVDGNTYNYNKTMEPNEKLQTENVNNGVVAYLDAQGYVAYIDESAITYDYAYVLSMGTDSDQYGVGDNNKGTTVYARLVLTDGTILKVETDAKVSEIGALARDGEQFKPVNEQGYLLNHIVSYSKDKNNVYTLTDRSGVAVADSPKTELEIKNGVASMTIDNKRYTANASTLFIVADTDKDSYDDYNFIIYTGVKNVPDIDGLDETKAVVAAKDGSNVAKVVYIEDADVSGTGNVIFVRADTNPKYVKNSETGNYYELNAYMDGSATTIQVKEGTSAAKALVNGTDMKNGVSLNSTGTQYLVALKAINENSDGLVTSVRLYGTYTSENGNGFIKGVGMEKAKDDAVLLDNITQWTGEVIGNKDENGNYSLAYAWDEEVIVAQYNDKSSKNQFSTSRISAIKDDDNDKYVAVLDGDVIVGICTVYVEDGEPGAIEGENITTKVNDNATLTVDSKDAKADYIRMNANGDGTYRFQVTLPDDGKTYGQVKYTETVYVNNSGSYETTKEVTKTIPANKMIEGTISVDIDTGDKVEVRITNVSLIETVPAAEQVTLTLKGNLNDAAIYDANDITKRLDNDDNSVTDANGSKIVTLDKDAKIIVVDDNIAAGNFVVDGKIVTTTEGQWAMTLSGKTVLDGAPETEAYVIHVADGVTIEGIYQDGTTTEIAYEKVGNDYYVNAYNAAVDVSVKTTDADAVLFFDDAADYYYNNADAAGTKAAAKTVDLTNISKDWWVYPASKVSVDSATAVSCGDDAFMAGEDNYYVVGTKLTLTCTNTDLSATIIESGKDYGIAYKTYKVGNADVTMASGWTVTLGEGVTATVSGEKLIEGDKIAAQTRANLSDLLKADETVGTTVVVKTNASVPYETAVGTTSISGACTVATATAVTLPASGVTVEYNAGEVLGWRNINVTGITTLYVEDDTQLRVSKTSGNVVVEGVEPDTPNNAPAVAFTVGADAVTVK